MNNALLERARCRRLAQNGADDACTYTDSDPLRPVRPSEKSVLNT